MVPARTDASNTHVGVRVRGGRTELVPTVPPFRRAAYNLPNLEQTATLEAGHAQVQYVTRTSLRHAIPSHRLLLTYTLAQVPRV